MSQTEPDAKTVEELKQRVEDLEARVDEPPDESDEWGVKDLTQLGLTRREALYVVAAMAAGYTFREAFLRATGRAEAGTQSVGDVGTADNPVDAFLEDVIGPSGTNPVTFQNDIQAGSGKLNIQTGMSTPAVDTEELRTSPPTTPFDWEGLHTLLQNGYCVNSLGNVFDGSTAPQDAFDDLMAAGNNGRVWLGINTYGPLAISRTSLTKVTIEGMGRDTFLDGGGTDPGLLVENPNYDQIGTARLRLKDFAVTTDGTSSQNGAEYIGAHEVWTNRVMSQSPGGHGFKIEDSRRLWYGGCFTEGAGANGLRIALVTGNKDAVLGVNWNGGLIGSASDDAVGIADEGSTGKNIRVHLSPGNYSYDQANFGWLTSDGSTLETGVCGTGRPLSDTTTQSGDDITFYGAK